MRNKKGFTLIELLSTIVVIAVITLIAFPVIRGVIEKVKLKALEDSAYGLVEASNLYYAQYQNENSVRFDKDDNINTLKNLPHKGVVENGTVIINQKGQVTVCVHDGKNSAYKNYSDKKVTSVARKTCNIPSNTYIVYLDNERTVNEYSNAELTQIVQELKEENDTLKSKVNTLENSSTTKDEIYPVGSIYISMNSANPSTLFGGTWERIKDTFILASGDSYAAGSTGGEATHTLTLAEIPSHAHTQQGTFTSGTQSANHTHDFTTGKAGVHSHRVAIVHTGAENAGYGIELRNGYKDRIMVSTSPSNGYYTEAAGEHTHSGTTGNNKSNHTHNVTISGNTKNAGSGLAHNNMPPYIAVYMWKRTA